MSKRRVRNRKKRAAARAAERERIVQQGERDLDLEGGFSFPHIPMRISDAFAAGPERAEDQEAMDLLTSQLQITAP
jgi:hypothetical protein